MDGTRLLLSFKGVCIYIAQKDGVLGGKGELVDIYLFMSRLKALPHRWGDIDADHT